MTKQMQFHTLMHAIESCLYAPFTIVKFTCRRVLGKTNSFLENLPVIRRLIPYYR